MTREEAKNWIKEFLNSIDAQDNRATASPYLFLLQTPTPVAVDGEHSYDRLSYYHPSFENPVFDSRADAEAELYSYGFRDERLEEEKEGIREYYIKDVWKTQQAFFTEAGVQRHLDLNKHNYGRYRTYVVHCFRNPEMQELFEVLRTFIEEGT